MTISKGAILQFNNPRSILDHTTYKVVKSGNKLTTLEAEHGYNKNTHLIGLPTFRYPFNIPNTDLLEAIEKDIYRPIFDPNIDMEKIIGI